MKGCASSWLLPQRCHSTAGIACNVPLCCSTWALLQPWDSSSKLECGVGFARPFGVLLGTWAGEAASTELVPAHCSLKPDPFHSRAGMLQPHGDRSCACDA